MLTKEQLMKDIAREFNTHVICYIEESKAFGILDNLWKGGFMEHMQVLIDPVFQCRGAVRMHFSTRTLIPADHIDAIASLVKEVYKDCERFPQIKYELTGCEVDENLNVMNQWELDDGGS